LVAAIATVFALQALWGGVDLPPLLAHMGSLVPERAVSGQWWRFVSCTFLHGGALHFGLNLFLLWMLGRFLERFVGSAQFLLIYFSSGLAGSVCSSLFVTSQSVGASGAICGLLGAAVALAFYPRPLVPTALISFARWTALAVLSLNLINSFNPHVDLAAHLGGGVMGALTFWLLAAAGQLPTQRPARARAALPVRLGAIALSCSFATGLVTAQWAGQPWRLAELPEARRVTMGASGWTVEIPRGLSAVSMAADAGSIEFGNLAYDACVVDINWVDVPRDALNSSDDLSMIQRQLAIPPRGLEQVRPAEVLDVASRRWVGVRYRYVSNPELLQDRAIGIEDGRLVRVDVTGWAALPQSFDGLAAHILHSVAPASPILSTYPQPHERVFHAGVPHPAGWRPGAWNGPSFGWAKEATRRSLWGGAIPFRSDGQRSPRCRTVSKPGEHGAGYGRSLRSARLLTLSQSAADLFSYTPTLKQKGTAQPPRGG
jgi:membrane associated rhomboid family serine protease